MKNLSIPKISRNCKWGDCIYYQNYLLDNKPTLISDAHSLIYSLIEDDLRYHSHYFSGYYFVLEYLGFGHFKITILKNFYKAKKFIEVIKNPCFILTRSAISR